MRTFVEVGAALKAIRDERLYRETHDTFGDYCKDRWNIARRTAYQLINGSQATENVRDCAQVDPTNEYQARPLTQLDTPAEQREAWAEAVEQCEGEQPTARVVEQVMFTCPAPIPRHCYSWGCSGRRKRSTSNRSMALVPGEGHYYLSRSQRHGRIHYHDQ